MSTFMERDKETLENFETTHIPTVQNAKFDMVLYLYEYKNGVVIETHYYKNLFRPEKIEKLMNSFLEILEQISSDKNKPLNSYGRQKKRLGVRLN
jgi:hypothetical protein